MTTNKQLAWVDIKDGLPPFGEDVEVRTNSMDRKYRLARYDHGFKCFYDDDNNEVSGNEWRLVYGLTPVTQEKALIMKNIDDVPEGYIQDRVNSNEYYITFKKRGDKSAMKWTYAYSETEVRSRW